MLEKFIRKFKENSVVYLRMKVRTVAQKTTVKSILDDDTIKVDVAAVPEKNKANKELVKYLSSKFDVCAGNITIISGLKEKTKLIKLVK